MRQEKFTVSSPMGNKTTLLCQSSMQPSREKTRARGLVAMATAPANKRPEGKEAREEERKTARCYGKFSWILGSFFFPPNRKL